MRKPITDVRRLLESRRARIGRWAAAALIVCILHMGGGGLALINWHEEEAADDVAGALTVELAPLPAPARVDSPDIAHGPEQQEAKLTREASKQALAEVEKDIPPVDPSPSPEAEVALPKPQPVEKDQPKEEQAQEAAPEKQRPHQARDTLAAAPPRVEAPPVPRSAPSPGQSASLARALASYALTLNRHVERHRRYPDAARRRRVQGTVLVAFTINRQGQVISSRITKSSGSPALDEEALAVLKRASPMPVPPDEIPGATIDCDTPIYFRLE
jgi:protein TonB